MMHVVFRNDPPRDGETVMVDNCTRTFVIKVRSLRGVGEDEIKDLIQQKFEVVSIDLADELIVGVA